MITTYNIAPQVTIPLLKHFDILFKTYIFMFDNFPQQIKPKMMLNNKRTFYELWTLAQLKAGSGEVNN